MPRRDRQSAERRGRAAEWAALASYLIRFYRPIAVRAKTPVGEIDLVLKRGDVLVFAEVKYRPTLDDAAYAIGPRQRQRIIRAAEFFRAGHPSLARNACRFDVICVAPWRLPRHVENAFPAAG